MSGTTIPIVPLKVPTAIEGDGMGCHSGGETLLAAARQAGKSDVLQQYAQDYPKNPDAGPHDQPQSMCPAFGSLRVGLRMRRTATILSGSACCVYGLTFTSHFYGARRSVGYVPFNSETLVTGKLFEDIREAVHDIADPTQLDAIVVINLCVPTASGVPLQLLPKVIDGVRVIGIDVPGFGVPTHAEAKDVLSGAMLRFAREEIMAGPVQAPRRGRQSLPAITLLGEMFPADPMLIGQMIAPMGLAVGATVFGTKAYDEVQIDQIAQQAGVSRGLLYHYFPSKRAFFAAIVQMGYDDILKATRPDPTRPASEQLRAGLEAYLDHVERHPHMYRALFRSAASLEQSVQEVVNRNLDQQAQRILAALGVSPTPHTLSYLSVRAWLAFLIQAVLDWLDHGKFVDRQRLIEVCMGALRGAIGSHPADMGNACAQGDTPN